jgi:hypothetical protein
MTWYLIKHVTHIFTFSLNVMPFFHIPAAFSRILLTDASYTVVKHQVMKTLGGGVEL